MIPALVPHYIMDFSWEIFVEKFLFKSFFRDTDPSPPEPHRTRKKFYGKNLRIRIVNRGQVGKLTFLIKCTKNIITYSPPM